MNLKDTIIVLAIVTFMSLFSNVLGTKAGIVESIPGLLILAVIALVGIMLSKYMPGGIPLFCICCYYRLHHDYPRCSPVVM